MNQQINIRNFTINKNENNFCKNFIYDIDSDYQLGILVEIKSPSRKKTSSANNDFDSLCDFIASNIKSEYDNNIKEGAFIRFENSIKKAESVLNAISENKTSLLNKMSILILATKNNELYFSKHGRIYACLFQGSSLINVSPRSTKIATPIKTTSKIFPHIINAKIKDAEKIIFLNDTSGEYCEQDQLEHLLKNDTDKSLEKLKDSLSKCDFQSSANFALLSLENKSSKIKIAKKEAIKKDVAEVVLPNGIARQDTEVFIGNEIEAAQQLSAIKTWASKLKMAASNTKSSIIVISAKLKNFKFKKPNIGFIKPSNKKTKIFVTCGVVVATVMLFQIYTTVAAKNQFQELTELISAKKNEATLLSSNNKNNEAIKKLVEAKSLAASMMLQLPNFKEESSQISADVEGELNKLAKITNITNPDKILELSNFGIKFEPQNIFKSGNQIMITGAEFGLVYKIDLETKRKGFNFFSTTEDRVVSASKSSNAMSFFSESDKTYIFYPASQKVVELNLAKNENQIIGLSEKTIDVYDSKLSEINILSQNNLSPIDKIIPQSAVLAMASDNKSIFTLNDDNKIIKISGSKQEQIADINTLTFFKKPSAIYTNDNTSFVYIASQNQIAVYSKNGEFIGQYNIGGINEIIDLGIPNNDEIFILTSDASYHITL